MNKKVLIQQIFQEIIGSNEVNIDKVNQYFAQDYIQKVDGKVLNLTQFIQHMQLQKQHIQNATTEFLALAEDGNIVFSNHIVHAEKKDGNKVAIQVIAQFSFNAEEKIYLCDELTHLIIGNQQDTDLGSRY